MQLSVKDLAKLLNVSEKTIYLWIKEKSIPVHRIQDQYRFNKSELLDWATSHQIHISPRLFQEPEHSEGLLTLYDALKHGGISYGLSGKDKPSVLRSIVNTLNLPEDVDRAFLYEVMMARETLGSTGVGGGIAIPHVRNPIVLHIDKPGVSLCFLEHPIDFQAIDGEPVNTIFTLISTTIKVHLHMLSRLSFLLRDKDFKKALKKQAAPEELLKVLRHVEESLPPLNGDDI
jgi:PTS system nitrogen regulatory IIA component